MLHSEGSTDMKVQHAMTKELNEGQLSQTLKWGSLNKHAVDTVAWGPIIQCLRANGNDFFFLYS